MRETAAHTTFLKSSQEVLHVVWAPMWAASRLSRPLRRRILHVRVVVHRAQAPVHGDGHPA